MNRMSEMKKYAKKESNDLIYTFNRSALVWTSRLKNQRIFP